METMLAQMSWPQWTLGALIIGVCLLLMIVILLQRGRGGGLSGAFGGGGGSAAFGAKTGDLFTWITVAFTAVFVLLTVVANFAFDESARPAPAAEVTEGDADSSGAVEPGDSDVKVLDLGGKPVKVGEGAEGLPIKIVPAAPGAGGAPKAKGTPTLPKTSNEPATKQDGKDGSTSGDDGANDDAGGTQDDPRL